jgi:hypothetical protein
MKPSAPRTTASPTIPYTALRRGRGRGPRTEQLAALQRDRLEPPVRAVESADLTVVADHDAVISSWMR